MNARWWGPFNFNDGETRHWRIGPFRMWLTRLDGEFRLVSVRDDEPEPGELVAGVPTSDLPPEDGEVMRFGAGATEDAMTIQPLTADRAFIFKSQNPFLVPPKGEVTAFLSSPVWVRLQLDDPERHLHQEPTFRPSDTWFGPTTIEGELCYAARTSVRFHLENLPSRPFRAVTVLKIMNHAESVLPLARIRLPLPHLSLYGGEDGRLWTENVILDRKQDGDFAEIKLTRSAPTEAGSCEKVSKPREEIRRHVLIRSFTSLLGLPGDRERHERLVD
jgi:hypothetical protein